MNRKLILLGLSLAAMWSAAVQADDKVQTKDREQKQVQQTTGREMMTPEERQNQRIKMRSAKTRAEREKMREEHHEEMKERAKEEGKSLPENPPAGGMGGGRGMKGGGNR
jgi:hypothetical protein